MTSTTGARVGDGEVVSLADGGRVLVRPLVASDRAELAERYLELSPEARRMRFFNAPDHLSERLLDYLVDVDGVDRCAVVAFAILALQSRGYRRFELVIAGMLGVILLGEQPSALQIAGVACILAGLLAIARRSRVGSVRERAPASARA